MPSEDNKYNTHNKSYHSTIVVPFHRNHRSPWYCCCSLGRPGTDIRSVDVLVEVALCFDTDHTFHQDRNKILCDEVRVNARRSLGKNRNCVVMVAHND